MQKNLSSVLYVRYFFANVTCTGNKYKAVKNSLSFYKAIEILKSSIYGPLHITLTYSDLEKGNRFKYAILSNIMIIFSYHKKCCVIFAVFCAFSSSIYPTNSFRLSYLTYEHRGISSTIIKQIILLTHSA